MTQLPGIAGEIEEVIGLDRAVTLLRARGGTEIALPKRVAGSHLARLVGTEAAGDLVDHFGVGKITLPCASMRGVARYNAERKARAMAMLKAGASLQAVALECDLALRTVSNYRAELDGRAPGRDTRQGALDL